MQVYEGLNEVQVPGEGRVVAIGVFDGVHLGHQSIIRETVEAARDLGVRPAVVTFDPHPEAVIKGGRGPRLLTTRGQKASLLSDLGIADMLVVRFDREFARLTPAEFCDSVLSERLGVKTVLVGEGFRFGRDGAGTAAELHRLGATHGFTTRAVPLVARDGGAVSSTRIRGLLSVGEVKGAASLLGRPYRIDGEVSAGKGRGRSLGAPTANIHIPSRTARPRLGVYVTRATVDGRATYAAVTSVGTNPTFEEGGVVRAETFLLDFNGDVSGSFLSVDFLERLRGQRKFPDANTLSRQIVKDIDAARRVHESGHAGSRN